VRSASGTPPEQAAAILREALALFRGEPLAELALEPWAQTEGARLEERRLAGLEARIDADLALGRHREAVPELEELVAGHPYHERLLELLTLALYRSGRQTDALEAHRRGVAALRTELGLEPGRALRELEQRILRHDEALEAPRAPPRNGRRRRGWKLVVGGAGALVAAALAAALVTATRGGNVSLASVAPGIAIVDSANGRLVSHIAWSDISWPAEVTTGDGSFWVWTIDGYSMVRIDGDGRVLRRIGSPFGGNAFGWVIDGGSIWFTGKRLVRTDIASGAAVDTYALTHDLHDDGLAEIARGGGSLWIARHQAGELLRVDPATGTVQHTFKDLHAAYDVVYGDGGAWVVTWNGVERVDAATNTVTDVPLPPPVAEAAVGGGYAWVSNEAKGVVYKIARSGQIVDTYATGDGARQMSYADGTLWVVNQDVGTITGIDATTGAEKTYRFGHPLQSVAALNGRLLVEINPGRTYEDRINALKGKVVRFLTPIYEFDHPDPAISGNGYVHSFIFQAERATCAPLLGYPDAPPPRGQLLAPEVAAARPTLSRDRRTYTFTIRTGFRFAPPSNAPLDAQTFRFSIERALSPGLGPRAPGIGFLGDLKGARAFHADHAHHVSGIRVDGNRISFTLTRPSPDFLERLALPYFCPVPRDTPTLDGGVGVYTGPAPPGAGPYFLSGIVFNGEYEILKRNPNYGGTRPQQVDAIAFREGVDTEKAIERVAGGRYDAVEQYDPLLAPEGTAARRFGTWTASRTASYIAFPLRMTAYLALDARKPPFADPSVRRAVAAALDRITLASFWGETPTTRLLPPGVRGARPPSVEQSARPRPDAVVRRTVTVRMAVPAGDDRQGQFADMVRAALAPIGIDVVTVPVADVPAALRDRHASVRLANLTTSLDYPDPASFLTRILGVDVPASWLPAATLAAVDRLDQLSGSVRDRTALGVARRAERDVVVIPYATQFVGTIAGPRVGCRTWNGVEPGLDLAALCLVRR
jgi:ABC-type transport system substrate-binding protein